MTPALALPLLLALGAGPPGSGRLLLCRPSVQGEPRLARAEAVAQAGRAISRFLDYGVPCEGEEEAMRAARRAGLGLAVSSVAEGRGDGSRYQLTLSSAEESRVLGRRELLVAPGADPVAPLRRSLDELLGTLPREPARVGPWVVVGAGAALLGTGGVLALVARSAADARDRAGAAGNWRGYVNDDARWRRMRTASGVTLGAGAAVAAAGLTWRFAF